MKRTLLLALSASLALPGCNGCNETERKPPAPAKTPGETQAKPPAGDKPAAEAAKPAAAKPAAPTEPREPYRGPNSKNTAGYTITTGFSDAAGKPVPQPKALAKTTVFVTVLGPGDVPKGTFNTFEGAEMHAFLLARDLRHAHYTKTSGAVAAGADARKVTFMPREGGDHALVTVFQPTGGTVQAVGAPVVFRGALPKIAGRGVAGLSARSRVKGGDVELATVPPVATVGTKLTLTARSLDNTGRVKAAVRPAFAVVLNDEMGGGEVVSFSQAGTASWTPEKAGTYLVLAPPLEAKGTTPLTFKITVTDPAQPAGAKPEAAKPAAAKPAAAKGSSAQPTTK